MALIVVLSVFNGFESVVINLFNAYNPELVVEPSRGKTIDLRTFPMEKVFTVKGVEFASKTVQENVLLRYKDKQVVASLKGVDENYIPMNRMDTMVIDGDFILKNGASDYAVFGAGVAYNLGVNLNDFFDPVLLYYPNREKKVLSSTDMGSFNTASLFPGGVFSVQQEYDEQIVIADIAFAQSLFSYDSSITALEIGLLPGTSLKMAQQELEEVLGRGYLIRNRFQQQELLYKVLRSEKLVVFLILSFIVLIAVFNVVGSLTMLILDKKKDIRILQSMGAEISMVRKIFLTQGMMITLAGASAGLLLGLLICLLQQQFGLLRLPDSESMILSFYPVVLKWTDFLIVFLTISLIGFLATLIPVGRIKMLETGAQGK
jgi:lipoprotein-releasing system permease protein